MNEATSGMAQTPSLLEKLSTEFSSGQTRGETQSMLGRGSAVFLGGMALAAASFFVEQAVVRAIRRS